MLKKSLSLFLVLHAMSLTITHGQDQPSLSQFTVTEIVDASSGSLSTMIIELTALNPTSLNSLEIKFFDRKVQGEYQSVFFSISIHNERPELKVDDKWIPFTDGKIKFDVKVRDQFSKPYEKLVAKAYGTGRLQTNELTYNRPK